MEDHPAGTALERHALAARNLAGSLITHSKRLKRSAIFAVKIPLALGIIKESIECKPMKSIASW